MASAQCPENTTPPCCFFNGCGKPAVTNSWKCSFHRNRGRCLVDECTNQAYARQLCARHGGKKKCFVDGCNLSARLANVCYKHGARNLNKKCIHDGCTKPAQFQQKCVRHGGGRKCKVEGCSAHARCGGLCCRHGREVGIVREKKAKPPIDPPSSPTSSSTSSSSSGGGGVHCHDSLFRNEHTRPNHVNTQNNIQRTNVVLTETFAIADWDDVDWELVIAPMIPLNLPRQPAKCDLPWTNDMLEFLRSL
ncbi:hypothetical protein DYB25_007704 [Aphanomyces astaci]|uniref:WRKY transcription factor 19 n=1 Tax=Aphanomyces astaci TaxID=112090 RepID=A0A397ADD9_APHAT|nr:hypothetical protein DYB36_002146 [Aphanomyces astaci]RHY18703.1 hypothetical protein DYB25_007704 [Aphanomyces astaci]